MIGLLLGAATIVAPIAAQAQEQGRGRDRGGWQGGGGDRGDRGGGDRGMQRGGGQERGGGWQRGGDRGANGDARREAIQQARESARAVERPAPVVQAPRADVAIDTGRQRQRDSRVDRNSVYRGDRDGIRRDWNRDGQRDREVDRDRDRRRDGHRSWSTDRRDWSREGDRRNDRWDRNWRNDRRYSWQDYRRQNRNAYRLPRYDARHGYSYRRWYPGYRFDSVFYSSNYWISDPFYYRLPPAYGDYRWVRYYDDAVLVDIYTGEIVDIIYSFFF